MHLHGVRSLGNGTSMSTSEVGSLVAGAARVVLASRLAAAALTLLTLPPEQRRPGVVSVAVLLAAGASSIALHRWNGIGSLVLRHPIVLGLDAVPVVVVLALVGDGSPWLLAMLSTGMLAGLFYGTTGASVFSILLVFGHALGLVADLTGIGDDPGVFGYLVVPLLVVGSAAAAAAVRRLLERIAASAREARESAVRVAAAEERARLARELHDSVAKTLHGIAMTAQALERTVHVCPDRAGAQALLLVEAAVTAAQESRELLTDLRTEQGALTLEDSVRELVARTAGTTGTEASVEVSAARLDERLAAETRSELVAILREALHNIARHAEAHSIRVTVSEAPAHLELVVRDDGVGIPQPIHPMELSRRGHHGLLGMSERASRCGGTLQIGPGAGGGTELRVTVPLVPHGAPSRASSDPGVQDRLPARRM